MARTLHEQNAIIAGIARLLADAIKDAAYTRKDEDKKAVTRLSLELVQAVDKEAADDHA